MSIRFIKNFHSLPATVNKPINANNVLIYTPLV